VRNARRKQRADVQTQVVMTPASDSTDLKCCCACRRHQRCRWRKRRLR